ncbi:histone acetyltransferase TAF1 250 [Babesia ovis]|uniref:Histone acetyltransferase TAF1 250 n=1 Tax=Babesia ovis TaxID=5869 RepID=A0A9W5WU81_BABOV|nr:histone acetyltransferase TAF1 250 [Babesia ovis]
MEGSGKVTPHNTAISDNAVPSSDSAPLVSPGPAETTQNKTLQYPHDAPKPAENTFKTTDPVGPSTAGESSVTSKMQDQVPPGMMPMPSMPPFFPFPPVPGMSMGSNEGQPEVNGNNASGPRMPPFGGWMMDGMMSMPMMQNMGTSIDGSLMPSMFHAPGSNGMKQEEGSQMPMMFYLPMMMDGLPPDFCKDANGKMMPPPNLMMPMLPMMDEKTALQSLNKLAMPQKTARQKRLSELDNMKSIPTSVQVRETCQLKAWRRKLQKGRMQQKLQVEGTVISPPVHQPEVKPVTPALPRRQASYEMKSKDSVSRPFVNMEMSWHQNKYRPGKVLSMSDMKQLLLYDSDDIHTYRLRAALKKLGAMDTRYYPYMFMDDFTIPVNENYNKKLRFWDDNEEDENLCTTQESDVPSQQVSDASNDDGWECKQTVESPSNQDSDLPSPDLDFTMEDAVLSADDVNTVKDEKPASPKLAKVDSPVTNDVPGVLEPINNIDDEFNIEDEFASDLDDAHDSEPIGPKSNADVDFMDLDLNDIPKGGNGGDTMDELEDELLGDMSNEHKISGAGEGDVDLDDEFDFDTMEEQGVAPPPAPPTFPLNPSGVPETTATVETSRIDDVDLFGEVPGTLSHHRARLSRLLNAGDVVHEWRGFRSRLGSNIALSDIVEFEHLWKVFQDKRVEDLSKALGRPSVSQSTDPLPEEKGELLYRIGKANMDLLLKLDRPEIRSLVSASIYNLNAPNTIYSSIPNEEDIEATEDDLLQGEIGEDETPQNDRFTESTAQDLAVTGEVDDETITLGKESEIRRNWRRRLQTLTKETRLALVNMGKSLRDIENVYCNVEQTRAYDSVVEFCEVAEMFRQRDYASVLNQSFDDYYEKCNPHDTGDDDSASNHRELLHTRVAKNLTGVMPLVGKAAKYHNVRFHKPDFRSGLFAEHLRVLRGNYSTEWCAWPVVPLLRSTLVDSFTEESGNTDDVKSHPSNYFIHSKDLSLNDDCKIALMEYVEQHPILLPNCGMASRIDNYVNYKEDDSHKDVAFLGPLGTLCQASDGIELFGVKHTVAPGDGQTVLEGTLFKAPIFVHPRPGSKWQDKLNTTTTDFLLTRCRTNKETVLRIRPLTWQSGVAVYTVGQCEPKVEVPAPSSKTFMEYTNDLLKAWVLKSVMVGSILDVKHLRKEARKKFCPVLSEKDISQMLKQIESTPIFSLRAQALERMIHSTIKPELVCALESVRAGKARLATMGILHMKNPDNIGGVYAKMQDEERQYQQRQQSMDKRLRELRSSYAKRLEAHGITGENLEKELQQFDFGLHVSIYGHLEEKTMAPKIRFIKEILDLTPWNISRDVKQVLNNRGTSQFALYGVGDPSGGRGEGINLLKRQARDVSVDNANAGEDLRKLSMQELAKRLRCYGVSDAVIKTLPRWDQVALVRQYRDGFGGQGSADGDHRWRIPPEEYQKKLNEILDRQKAALSRDSPIPSDDEAVRDEEGDATADGIADALLEAFNEVSDKDDDMEMRELEILRQLRETQNSGPLSEEERMAEVNKLKAVPGIMWLRQSRRTSTEPFGNDRAVFVYGEENVRKLLRWRAQRNANRKAGIQGDMSVVGNFSGKRVCRNCGQPGHIASNPKCPLYKGDKARSATDYHVRGRGSGVSMANRKPHRYSDSSDCEITASTAALECDTAESVLRNYENKYKRRLIYQASMEESDDGLDPFDEGIMITSRRKQARVGDTTAVPAANVSSQMEQLMKLVSKAVRLVEKEPRFKPFTSRIPESVAPNYYQIIKNPMWLSLLKSKCKTRCYHDMVQVLDDLALIELNCKQFNSETSPNAWLRKMSETLVDELLMRIQQLTSHLVSPSVIEEWARGHRANRIVSEPAPVNAGYVPPPVVNQNPGYVPPPNVNAQNAGYVPPPVVNQNAGYVPPPNVNAQNPGYVQPPVVNQNPGYVPPPNVNAQNAGYVQPPVVNPNAGYNINNAKVATGQVNQVPVIPPNPEYVPPPNVNAQNPGYVQPPVVNQNAQYAQPTPTNNANTGYIQQEAFNSQNVVPPVKRSEDPIIEDLPDIDNPLSAGPEDSLDRFDDFGDFGDDSFYDEWSEKMADFHPSAVLSFDIAPKGSDSFFENVRNTGTLLRGMYYTLSKTEELNIHLVIKSPSGEVVYEKETPEGIYAFEAKVPGVYTLEFSNPNWMTPTGVTLAAGSDEHSVLKSEHIRNTESRLKDLKGHVDSVYAQFKYIWLHNHRQMRASRDAQTKLLLYSVIQLLVVGVCSLICVSYVKRIVSHKRIL